MTTRTLSRSRSTLALTLAAALAGCGGEGSPRAELTQALFPAVPDSAFHPVRCAGPDAGDAAADPVTGNLIRDMIGDATYPAFYRYGTTTDVLFRMRVDKKPTKNNGTLEPSSWDVLIDTDGNLDTYEYMITADGNLGGTKVLFVRNRYPEPANPKDPANETAADLIAELTPASDWYEAKQAADGSSFNGDADWFMTLRIPKALLASVGVDVTRSFVVWGGTNAQNYSLNADFGCFTNIPTTLSQAASLPVNLDPDGAPAAAADAAATPEDAAVTVDVLANDAGLRDAPLAVSIVTPPSAGTAAVEVGNTVRFTPAPDASGTFTFAYQVTDADGQASSAEVTVTVAPVDDGAPAPADDVLVTSRNVANGVDVLANDVVVDGPAVVAVAAGPAHGTVAVAGGTITYTPALDHVGADSFTYRVTDADGQTSTAIVSVTVLAGNSSPLAAEDAATVAEDGAVTVDVLANDADVDGDPLSIAEVTQGAHGAVAIEGGAVTYVPSPEWSGEDEFTYTASDGKGGTATATVAVTVTPVADAPVAAPDAGAVAEDGSVVVDVLANDLDADGDALAVSAVTQGASGAVSVDAGGVRYTPAADWSGTDSFTYTVSDGGGTATATVTVVVSAVNDAPVAGDDAVTVAEDGAVTVDVLANDADVEADALSISAVTQGAHGVVSIVAGGARYAPAADWSGTDSFTYTVSDGNGGDAEATVTVTVTPANDAPAAAGDAATVAEDGAVTVDVLANDTDPDGDPLSVSAVMEGAHGAVSIVAGGVRYVPAADWSGTDSFTYTASDGNGGDAEATVTVTVTPANDAPAPAGDAATVAEDGAVTVDVLANDSDPDGDPLSVSAVTQGAHGTAAIVAGGVRYAPAADWSGTDSFTYTASDGNGGASVTTVVVTVTPVNDAPSAAPDAETVEEDGSVTVLVLANDSDPEDDALSLVGVTQGAHGAVTVMGGAATYIPAASWSGADSFTYTVSDGNGAVALGTVTITVTPANDAPVAGADAAAVAEDGSVTVDVLANDADLDGDALSVSAVTQGAHGAVSIVGGAISYVPAANWSGTDSFTYTVSDGGGGLTVGLVTVTVTPENDPPAVAADAAVVAEEGSVTVDVLANDGDLDGDALSISAVTQGAHGAVSIVAGGARYVPAADWSGTDSFTYTVSDGNGGLTVGLVTVTVTPENDAPVAGADAAAVAEDGSVAVDVLANDADLDGDALSVSAVTQGAHGAVSIVGGAISYVPAANWSGTDSFTYTVSDGNGGLTVGLVTVTVTPENDPPAAAADAAVVAEDGSVTVDVLANDADLDGDALSVSAVTQGAHGAVSVVGGAVRYVPAAEWSGTDSFTYTISDGSDGGSAATVTITVTPVNDAPVAGADAAAVAEDGSVTVDVLANDSDLEGDPLSISAVTQGAHGAVSVVGGVVRYAPAADWSGTDSFTYTVADGNGGSATHTVTVTVAAVNDAPAAADDAAAVAEDGSVTVDVLANDADADGDGLSISAVTQGAHGAVSVVGGAVRYVPAAEWSGTDSFTYTVSDGNGGSATHTVTVTVAAVNDAPVAAADVVVVARGGAVSVGAGDHATDPDGDALVVSNVTQGAHGAVALEGGVATYTPEPGYAGPDSFTYTVSDGNGGTVSVTVSVTVEPAASAGGDGYRASGGGCSSAGGGTSVLLLAALQLAAALRPKRRPPGATRTGA